MTVLGLKIPHQAEDGSEEQFLSMTAGKPSGTVDFWLNSLLNVSCKGLGSINDIREISRVTSADEV